MIFLLLQDSDCLICFGSHATRDCHERTPNHCPDCHVLIRHCSDHAAVCGSKTWIHKTYNDLYANHLTERLVISIGAPFRFWINGCWRKAFDGIEMYSTLGAFFRFKSDQDLSLLSRIFVGIRIGFVVKIDDKLLIKLWLITSKSQFVTAVNDNREFNRNDPHNTYATLLLAVTADENPCVHLHVFPKNKVAREYRIRYDNATHLFNIPDGLRAKSVLSTSADSYGDGTINAQLESTSEVGAQSLQLVEYNADMRDRLAKIGTENRYETDVSLQQALDRCFECHAVCRNLGDHAEICPVKQWFVSKPMEKYVKIPSIRWSISSESPISVLLNGHAQPAQPGLKLFSGISDAYFQFESYDKVVLMTTAYTRIRVPIVIEDDPGKLTEKLVLFTSPDRALVCARGSRRIFEDNATGDYEHNTPLVLYMLNSPFNLNIKVHSAGGQVNTFRIPYQGSDKKFSIPDQLDVKSPQMVHMKFDATLPSKFNRK